VRRLAARRRGAAGGGSAEAGKLFAQMLPNARKNSAWTAWNSTELRWR
jgi:hypothetical protein